jgi:hypothetical protein
MDSNNENYAPKNYNYIFIKYILLFLVFYLVSHLLSDCPLAICKNEVRLYLLLLFFGRWQNDQHTLNTTDAVMTVGQQTGLLIIFGRPP